MKYSILILILLLIAQPLVASLNDQEFDDALQRAYDSEMTIYETENEFMPLNTLTREQGAKMYAVFATKHLCMVPDETKSCNFTDTTTADPTLQPFLKTACQLGLFQGYDGKFMPKSPLTKAQAITVLVRAIDEKKDESGIPWWNKYFIYAQDNGLTKETDVYAVDKNLTRYESLLMQYRSKSDTCADNTVGYSEELLTVLEDLFGDEPDLPSDNEQIEADQQQTGDSMSGNTTTGTTLTGSSGTGSV